MATTERLQNWSRNLTYSAARVHRPTSVEEVQSIVAGAERLRTLGSRHSFNAVADTPHDLLSTERLNRIVGLDRERSQVTVEGGVRYGELGEFLRREGFALPNMASLPHISVAGAVATATHGSGIGNGNLATSVAAIEFVRADGELVRLSREDDPDTFPGAVVSLGGLGPVVRVTLDVEPMFEVAQTVYDRLPFARLAEFDAIESLAYSVSLFTHWRDPVIDQVWLKRCVEEGPAPASVHEARPADGPRHPIATMSPEYCTLQGGVPGPWDERLPHFQLRFTPSAGEELQAEYILSRRHAWAALQAIDPLRDQIAPLLQITEIRTFAADDLWMSPGYEQDAVCIHFTLLPDWPGVRDLLPKIEAALAPFEPRPHWGKLFTMAPEAIRPGYSRLSDFDRLLRSYDPEGKFRNDFLNSLLGT